MAQHAKPGETIEMAEVEAWLRRRRDALDPGNGDGSSTAMYCALDDALDDLRDHYVTGTPLVEDVIPGIASAVAPTRPDLAMVEIRPIIDVSEIPKEYRLLLARWLVRRAETFRPSWLLPLESALNIQDALKGCAVDLVEPESDDQTVTHANAVLAQLAKEGA